jgi:hypothetical protein
MSNLDERRCVRCEGSEEDARLERCVTCGKYFCADCSYRATGRHFCSAECARSFFYGDSDDSEHDDASDD